MDVKLWACWWRSLTRQSEPAAARLGSLRMSTTGWRSLNVIWASNCCAAPARQIEPTELGRR